MNSLFTAIFSEISNRMKTPLLGTFVLCWLMYNHDYLAQLLFSDNAHRLALIEKTPFYWTSDFLIPFGFSLLYIFLVPLVQWGIDIAKYTLIEKRRTKTHHNHLLDKYRSQANVARQQNKASVAYWQDLSHNHAENAGKQIISLKSVLAHEVSQVSKLEKRLNESEKNNDKVIETSNGLNNDLTKYREQIKGLNMKLDDLQSRLNSQTEKAQRWKSVIDKSFGFFVDSESSGLSNEYFNDCLIQSNSRMIEFNSQLRNNEVIKNNNLFSQVEENTSSLGAFVENIITDIRSRYTIDNKKSSELFQLLGKASGVL